MLHVLTIKDYALVDHMELAFTPGFNVLTGETGAGKSIIVDAIGLLLGKRADEGLIRAEARQARVEGLFVLAPEEVEAARDALEEAGLPADDAEEVVVVREINHQGRNVCRVNGAIVPLRTLAALGERLVDIHGQNQQLPLLNIRAQRAILDSFGGLEPLTAQVGEAVARLRSARRELADLRGDEREQARRADLLRYQVDEIAAGRLQPVEDEQLEAEQTIAANAERLKDLAALAYEALYEGRRPHCRRRQPERGGASRSRARERGPVSRISAGGRGVPRHPGARARPFPAVVPRRRGRGPRPTAGDRGPA